MIWKWLKKLPYLIWYHTKSGKPSYSPCISYVDLTEDQWNIILKGAGCDDQDPCPTARAERVKQMIEDLGERDLDTLKRRLDELMRKCGP